MTETGSQKVVAYINHRAGTCWPDLIERALELHLGDRLLEVIYLGHDVDVAASLASDAASSADVVVVAGGDGSVASVAQHLVRDARKLLIIPCGTANNLAKALGISTDVAKAIALIDRHRVRELDAMKIGDRFYFSHVSAGVYANAARDTKPSLKAILGRLAHVWNGLRGILQRKRWHFRLTVDEKTHSTKASTLMIANVGRVGGGGFEWGKGIEPDDGMVNICAIHARAPSDYLGVILDFLRFRKPIHPRVTHWTAKKVIQLDASERLPLRGDGEEAGSLPAKIEIEQRVLKVIVPA